MNTQNKKIFRRRKNLKKLRTGNVTIFTLSVIVFDIWTFYFNQFRVKFQN